MQILFKCPTPYHGFLKNATKTLTFLLILDKVHNPLRLPRETTSEPPKVPRTCGVLYIFHFDMCFAPQRRALFPHRNLQKWREHVVFCYIFTSNHNGVDFLDISTAKSGPHLVWFCTFLTCKCVLRHNGVHFFRHLNCQKCSETQVFCYILTCKCASRHNGVQFFISHLAS